MDTILIVEDERDIVSFLKPELIHEGYAVRVAENGMAALEALQEGGVDLALLDILLPGISGMEVLRRVRKKSTLPVIMLTARADTCDKVAALDQGADDYLVKPFEIEELLARIRCALRKTREAAPARYTLMDLTLDAVARSVTVGDEGIELSAKEFDLLKYLMTNQNIVLSREKILNTVWGYDYVGEQKAVDVYVSHLRAKLDERFQKTYITTVRGMGYMVKKAEE